MPITQFPIKFNPRHIPDCGLWLRADAGITLVDSKVSQWNDQSGHSRHFVQNSDTRRPTFEESGLNNKATLYFNQAHFLSRSSDSLIRNRNGATIIAAYKSAGVRASQGQCLFYFTTDTTNHRFVSWQVSNGTDGQIYGRRLDADSTLSTDVSTAHFVGGTAHVYTYITDWANGAAYMRRGGTQLMGDTSYSTSGYTSDTNSLLLGLGAHASGAGNFYSYGRLSEFIVYQRTLTSGELVLVERYLGFKYGITVA